MSTGDVVAITVEYLPDSDFYSGADADVCTEDDLCIFVTHHLWRLDLE